jgi:hypothetical protein
MRQLIIAVAALAALVAAPPASGPPVGRPAAAQPAPGDAVPPEADPAVQALIDQAEADFKAARYPEALRAYGRALAAGGPPALRFMLGRCHQMLEQWREARDVYRAILADPAQSPQVRGRTEAELAAVEARLTRGTLVLHVAPFGALVVVDGRPAGTAPLAPLTLPAGRHTLQVTAEGREPAERTLDVPGGETTQLTLELRVATAAPPPEPEPEPEPEPPLPIVAEPAPLSPARSYAPWTWVTLGTGLAAAAGGTVSYALGEGDHQKILDTPGYDTDGPMDMTRRRALDLESSGDTKKLAGYVLWGVGGALVVTSAVLFLLDGPAAEPDGSVHLSLVPAPGGGVFGLGGEF